METRPEVLDVAGGGEDRQGMLMVDREESLDSYVKAGGRRGILCRGDEPIARLVA